MGVQILTPGVIPIQWNVDQGSVAPGWQDYHRGLVGLWTGWYTGGAINIISGKKANSGVLPSVVTRHGLAIEGDGTLISQLTNSDDSFTGRLSLGGTMAVFFRPDLAVSDSWSALVALNSAGGDPVISMQSSSSSADFNCRIRTTTTYQAFGAIGFTDLEWQWGVIQYRSVGLSRTSIFDRFGARQSTKTQTDLGPLSGAPSRWSIHCNQDESSLRWGGQTSVIYVWDHYKPESALQPLFRDPFGPFRPDFRTIGKAPVVAGARPQGPLGHPFHGPFAGPIAA